MNGKNPMTMMGHQTLHSNRNQKFIIKKKLAKLAFWLPPPVKYLLASLANKLKNKKAKFAKFIFVLLNI